MCGITGILGLKRFESESIIKKMTAILAHRGPDGEDFLFDDRIALGHKRLKIIDLSDNAKQPMSNEDNTIWLVFNGEIYNFHLLRKDLEGKGHRFKSLSDAEVIIHLYEEYGENCLDRLEGMFAFAIWDRNKNNLFIARDHLGIKPLYYYWNGSIFIFASEIKAIIKSGLIDKIIDEESLILYLKFGYMPSPKTIYKNIFSLEPAYYLILKEENLQQKKYWDLTACFLKDKLNIKSEKDAQQLIRSRLKNSINKHLISDVPVGLFLSGGVDSSSIALLLREVSNNEIKAITAIFPNTVYDESKYAEIISQQLGIKHSKLEISKEDLKWQIKNFFIAMDQPTADGLNTYLVSWVAKEAGLKVCLSGLGGDELFGGYSSFWQIPRLYRYLKLASFLKFPKYLLPAYLKNGKINRVSNILNHFSFNNIYLDYRTLFSKQEVFLLLGKNSTDYNFNQYLPQNLSKIKSPREVVSILETSIYMANQLLKDADVFGMANSVEIRVPFVDHKLIEFLGKIPDEYKYKESPNKWILIKSVGNLPHEIYQRPKQGFTLPLDTWMRNEFRDEIEEDLLSFSIFNKIAIKKFLKSFYENKLC